MKTPRAILGVLQRQPSLRAALAAAAMPLGVRSKSEPHVSDLAHEPNDQGGAVVVLGTARGGTSTVQARIAKALRVRSVFEPFGDNHLELETFAEANRLFRLGGAAEQFMSNWAHGLPPHCSDLGGRDSAPAAVCMADHLRAMHANAGRALVWKEIRLLYSLPLIVRAYESLETKPTFVLVQCDPLSVAYSFYRMVALGKHVPHGRQLDGFYENRLALFRARWGEPSTPLASGLSTFQKVVSGALLDKEAIGRWGEHPPAGVHIVGLSSAPSEVASAIQSAVEERYSTEHSAAGFARMPAWSRDPLFRNGLVERLGPDLVHALGLTEEDHRRRPQRPSLRQVTTHCLNRFCQ
jgi:hypothetical protein